MRTHPNPAPRRRSPNARRAGAVLAGGLCVTAAVAIWALITGSFDDTSARLLASGLAAAMATLAGLAGTTVLGRRDHRHLLGQATIAASGLALALGVVLIWDSAAQDGDLVPRALGIALAALVACVHASLMCGRMSSRDRSVVRTLTKIAIGSVSSAALLVGCLLAFVTGEVATGVWRLLGVIVVIAVLTTLLAPLARRLTADSRASGAAANRRSTASPASRCDATPS